MKCYPSIAKEIDPEFKLEKTETINARQQNPIPQKDSASTSKVIETQQVVVNRLSNNVTEGITPSQSTQSASENNDTELSNLVRKNLEFIEKEPDLKKAIDQIKKEIVENPKIDPDLAQKVEKAALEAEKLQSIGKERLANHASQLDQAGRDRLIKMLQQVETILKQNQTKPSESINQALKQLQKEPNLEKALDQVRREITSNPTIDSKTINKVEKALDQATQLQDKGRELAARQHITKELTEIQQELAKTEPKINTEQKSLQEQMQYDLNEQMQSLNIQSKDILVTKVTQKLAQVTHDFRELKREISRNLDNVERLVNTFKKNAYPQAKQMLETTISKLDNAILKSDMMLFTDMKTEKQLMNASTQLAEAKKLLAKGRSCPSGKNC